jgi:hypothetical protein
MSQRLVDVKHIADCKAWANRGVVKALQERSPVLYDWLRRENHFLGDLGAARLASEAWLSGSREIPVGKSRTLNIMLRALDLTEGGHRTFLKDEELAKRRVSEREDILFLPAQQLLALEGGTTQWLSAVYQISDAKKQLELRPFMDADPKLIMTVESDAEWKGREHMQLRWEPRKDQVLLAQAEAYVQFLLTGRMDFVVKEREDFAFGIFFEKFTVEEGAKRWPGLAKHESNRLISVVEAKNQVMKGQPVDSEDHRVIQASMMFAQAHGIEVNILHPDSVSKSWPRKQFEGFLREYSRERISLRA